MQRVGIALKIHFALLAALGGVVLGVGEAAGVLPLIAIFSALFSLVFIDLLGLFALPSLAAYIGMGLVAAYCISDFVPLDPTNNRQLTAVAQLLVLVQAVLMLQKKTRRVFEQIGVFCMLELVVAAVFNNALIYAGLLIPISLLGLSAMVLLQVATAVEPAMGTDGERHGPFPGIGVLARHRTETDRNIRTSAARSVASLAGAGRRLPRLTLLTAAFPVLLVAATFFYALPRTAESDGSALGVTPVVGFSDHIDLNQMGNLLQSNTPVMRVQLKDAETGLPYSVMESLYLRGAVLDAYDFDSTSGRWRSTAVSVGSSSKHHQLPRQFQPERPTDKLFYDEVIVDVTIQPQSTSSLFGIAPYHRLDDASNIAHGATTWTVARRGGGADAMYPRMSYRFGTHAFFNGWQSDMIRHHASHDRMVHRLHRVPRSAHEAQDANDSGLLRFDEERMPTIKSRADALVAQMDPSQREPHRIARRFRKYLQMEAGLEYTLDLTMERDPSLDPVEQFIRFDRRGHCQYFASTLAMMLRSQGIPARLVVGYKSDEFSPFGQHYIIRQLHAHAWVEALLQEDELPENRTLYGQPKSGPVWMRLDPTPSGVSTNESVSAPIAHRLDYLQLLWERYVLDMDAERQDESMLDAKAMAGTHGTYAKMFQWTKEKWQDILAKQWGGEALGDRPLFSWPAAVMGVLGTLAVLTLYRVGLANPAALFRRRADALAGHTREPRVSFFVAACDQLRRVGVERRPAETASEFAQSAGERLCDDATLGDRTNSANRREPSRRPVDTALAVITDAYYRVRFGGESIADVEDERITEALADVQRAVERRLAVNDSPA